QRARDRESAGGIALALLRLRGLRPHPPPEPAAHPGAGAAGRVRGGVRGDARVGRPPASARDVRLAAPVEDRRVGVRQGQRRARADRGAIGIRQHAAHRREKGAGAADGVAERSARVKLGIDVVGALRPHTRAGRYTAEFVSALTRIDPGPEVVLFCNAFRVKDAGKVLGLGPPVVNPRIPGRVLLTAWRCLRWPPIDVLIGPVDGFHTSDWVHPPQRHGATLATVHDVGALVHPDWYAPDVVEVHRRKNEAAARKATAIITG